MPACLGPTAGQLLSRALPGPPSRMDPSAGRGHGAGADPATSGNRYYVTRFLSPPATPPGALRTPSGPHSWVRPAMAPLWVRQGRGKIDLPSSPKQTLSVSDRIHGQMRPVEPAP